MERLFTFEFLLFPFPFLLPPSIPSYLLNKLRRRFSKFLFESFCKIGLGLKAHASGNPSAGAKQYSIRTGIRMRIWTAFQ